MEWFLVSSLIMFNSLLQMRKMIHLWYVDSQMMSH